MHQRLKPFVVAASEGRTVEGPAGGPIQFKALGEQTGGSVVILTNLIEPGEGPPLHHHADCDESWFIMEGEFRFRLGDDIHEAPAGSVVFVPRGVDHCFQNVGDRPARLLVIFTPAGMAGFFEEFATFPRGPLDEKKLADAAGRWNMTITGPPLRD